MTEEERAALYREQQKRRAAWRKANAVRLAGNRAAYLALVERMKALRKDD